jgi:hypothetical protein
VKRTIAIYVWRTIRAIEVLKGDRVTISKPQAVHLANATEQLAKKHNCRLASGTPVDRAIVAIEFALQSRSDTTGTNPVPVSQRKDYPPLGGLSLEWNEYN